jgi:hypothetical protein
MANNNCVLINLYILLGIFIAIYKKHYHKFRIITYSYS